MTLMLKSKIKRPGLRGGKYWMNKHGEVVYGEKPHPKAKEASKEQIAQHQKKPRTDKLDKLYEQLKKEFGNNPENFRPDLSLFPKNIKSVLNKTRPSEVSPLTFTANNIPDYGRKLKAYFYDTQRSYRKNRHPEHIKFAENNVIKYNNGLSIHAEFSQYKGEGNRIKNLVISVADYWMYKKLNMTKARVKQHQRRTKSGKVVTVKEHETTKQKQSKPQKKLRTLADLPKHTKYDKDWNPLTKPLSKKEVTQIYTDAGMKPEKVIRARIDDGYYVYHRYGSESISRTRKLVKKEGNTLTFKLGSKLLRSDFVGDDDPSGIRTNLKEAAVRSEGKINPDPFRQYPMPSGLLQALLGAGGKTPNAAFQKGEMYAVRIWLNHTWSRGKRLVEKKGRVALELNQTGMVTQQSFNRDKLSKVVREIEDKGYEQVTLDKQNMKGMNKSRVKAHLRRTKSGKIIQVREHEDSRTKKPKPIPKPKKDKNLFGEVVESHTKLQSNVKEIRVADIEPDPDQPRKDFDEDELRTLASSIKKIGLIQDIAVRPHPTNAGKYIIIAGERRWRAHKIAGIGKARTRVYNLTEAKDIFSIQVAENVGRKEMNSIETATAFKRLYDAGVPIDDIAKKVGAKPVTVERKMQLLDLIPGIQKHVKQGHISIHQGWMIANAKLTPELQHNIMIRLNAGKISNEALSGMLGKYKAAMSQTDIFQAQEATPSGLERLHKNTVRSLERKANNLVKEVGKLLTEIDEQGGEKVIPAITKERGKLGEYSAKLDIITSQMIKIKKEMDRAKAFFNAGGTVSQYLDTRKVGEENKWVFEGGKRKRKKAKKSVLQRMLKTILGYQKKDHKYIKREGLPGNYKYTYPTEPVKKADILLEATNNPNIMKVLFDFKWGDMEWEKTKNAIKQAGSWYYGKSKTWYIKRQNIHKLHDRLDKIAISAKARRQTGTPPPDRGTNGRSRPKTDNNREKFHSELALILNQFTNWREYRETQRKMGELVTWAKRRRLQPEIKAARDKLKAKHHKLLEEGEKRGELVKVDGTYHEVKEPGKLGSTKWWIDNKGKVRYGDKPKNAQQIKKEDLNLWSGNIKLFETALLTKNEKKMAYYKKQIEAGAKEYVEDIEAEKGSGRLKLSTVTKEEREASLEDYAAIIQYARENKYLRIPTRGKHKGKVCINNKELNTRFKHKADSIVRDKLKGMRRMDRNLRDEALAPPKTSWNKWDIPDHYKLSISKLINDYNSGKGEHVIEAIFAKETTGSKDLYEQIEQVQARASDIEKHRRKALKAFSNTTPPGIKSMKKGKSLWAHQAQYVNWMMAVDKGIVGADTALGKTLMALGYIKKMQENGKIDGGLAFLPGSVMYGWEDDLDEFFKGRPKVLYIEGTPQEKMAKIKSIGKKKYDLVVASHGLIQGDGKLLTELMRRTKKHAVFYDESHKGLLNTQNNVYKNFHKHVKQKYQFLMTATPARNEPLDIMRMNDLLHPGHMGNAGTFHSNYYERVRGQWHPRASAMDDMWDKASPYIPVMSKYAAGVKLPKRVDSTHRLSMGDQQKKYYEAAQKNLMNVLLDVENPEAMKRSEVDHIFKIIAELRLTAFDPVMINPKYRGKSVTFERTSDIIGDHLRLGKNGIVVASAFTKPFSRYATQLKKEHGLHDSEIAVIDKDTKPKERHEIQKRMNSGKVKVLLMGIASGGAGMNLQKGADAMVILSDPWTYADKKQAVDRIIRPGAASDTVFVHDFSLPKTITDLVRGKIEIKQSMHEKADVEGTAKEKMATWSFDDYLKLIGMTKEQYQVTKKKVKPKKAKKSMTLPKRIAWKRQWN